MAHEGAICTTMGNSERNSFVCDAIEKATVRLLADRELADINVSQIVAEAQVSRNSFYRNYASKEDVLLSRVRTLLGAWQAGWEASGFDSGAAMYGSLFTHLKDHADLYLLLERRSLSHLLLQVLLEQTGPRPDLDNMWAYTTAFISYGTYGWIREWMRRGMQESAESMAELLSSHGMA